MKILVSVCAVFLIINSAMGACYLTECDTEMAMEYCGTTDVECSYEDGPESQCDVAPFCSCRNSNLVFVYGIGCACLDGFYGAIGDGNCYPCPGGGTSDVGDNTAITSCYIPSNTISSNGTGTFIYTADCRY